MRQRDGKPPVQAGTSILLSVESYFFFAFFFFFAAMKITPDQLWVGLSLT
jgi:hypothetical protein